MDAELASLKATIYGRVQGVFFRAYVSENAEDLGLTGYVRNRSDEGVEVVAEGEKERLEKLLQYLKKGPPAARVARMKTHWSEYTGSYSGFRIRY
jgi:acylphosphatase